MTVMLGLAMLNEEATRSFERPHDDQWFYDEYGPPIGSGGLRRAGLRRLAEAWRVLRVLAGHLRRARAGGGREDCVATEPPAMHGRAAQPLHFGRKHLVSGGRGDTPPMAARQSLFRME